MTAKELNELEWIAKHHPIAIEVFDHVDAQTVLWLIAACRERDALVKLAKAYMEAELEYANRDSRDAGYAYSVAVKAGLALKEALDQHRGEAGGAK